MVQGPAQDRRAGTVVGGRYRLLSVIGSGGMGVVYRAEHLLLKKELALKILHAHLKEHPRGPELMQRFVREAQSLARLDQQHPHMVQIIDCGVAEDGTLYMAMELCEGEPLCEVISRGPLPAARALHIIVQVLRALVHAHGKGIIHRDLKPDNVMLVRRDGREDFVKILDFGIAKLLTETEMTPAAVVSPGLAGDALAGGPPGRPGHALTQAGVIFGTPEYLAPEQARGLEVDQRTDLYSVGVILWELLVGRRPFAGDTPMQVIGLHLMTDPDPPSRHAPGPIPASLDQVVLRAMAKDPQERYASAEEFLRALDVVLMQLDVTPGRTGRSVTPLLTGLIRALTRSEPAVADPGQDGPDQKDAPQAPQRPLWVRLGGRLVRALGLLRRRLRDLVPLLAERLGVKGTAVAVGVVLLLGTLGIARLAAYVARVRPPERPPPPPAAAVQRQAVPVPAQAPVPEVVPQVALEALIDRLEHGLSCNERRSAALALYARGDPRALAPLMRARKRASGRRAQNGCMLHDLDDAIRALKEQGSPPPTG